MNTLLSHIEARITQWFHDYPVPAHGADHAKRVAVYADRIARAEQTDSFFVLCSSWFHDIGRVPEYYPESFPQYKKGERHQELSYLLLREWFCEDRAFDVLSDEQKKEILYAVRYHGNDVADTYQSAMILRDADKLDLMGEIGVDRHVEWVGGVEKTEPKDFWLRYYSYHWLRTAMAKKIADDEKMLEPFERFMKEKLEKEIEDIVL